MAKYAIMGDGHIRASVPEGRCDTFLVKQFAKWRFVLDTCQQYNVDGLLQPGDLFDLATPTLALLNQVIVMFSGLTFPIYTIPGQHDLLYRSTKLSRTGMGVLENAGVVEVLDEQGVNRKQEFTKAFIAGHPYGGDYRRIKDRLKDFEHIFPRILVTHDNIGDNPLYPGHEYSDCSKFLRAWPEFDLIVVGDYHYPFHVSRKSAETGRKRHIVNCGALMRVSRDERDMLRKPRMYIYDTKDTQKLKRIFIPHDLPAAVFTGKSFNAFDKQDFSLDQAQLQAMIEKLQSSESLGVNFHNVLDEYYSEHSVRPKVQHLIEEVLSE